MLTDERYMWRCLELARKGKGAVAPNPMVGAVVVYKGEVIGEGYHSVCGGPHAEVEAIRSVRHPEYLPQSTLYVSLEPCCHYGKTPPCTELILQHRIPRVVVACADPNPEMDGKGVQRLRDQGCEVVVGVLEKEARELNRRFFTAQEKRRPYIILKWAQTQDGFMDIVRRDPADTTSYWITNDALKLRSHVWRTEESAIWVGANTILHDNPRLNARYAAGRNPLRVAFFDTVKEEMRRLHFFDASQPTLVFHFGEDREAENLSFCHVPAFDRRPDGLLAAEDLDRMLQVLFECGRTSVLVEGGRHLLESFLSAGLWDEARVLTGSVRFGKGLPAPCISRTPVWEEAVEDNRLQYYRKR